MTEIKDWIARRVLTAGNNEIVVYMFKPEEDGGDFRCRYLIEMVDKKKEGYAIGMDSFQALQLAMQRIGVDLVSIEMQISTTVTWLDDTPGENGFPRP